MKRRTYSTKGFTLIETMVYLALFAVIIGGAIVAGYQIIESSGRNQTRSMMQEEGDFLISKIEWALSGVQVVSTPPQPALGNPCTTDAQLAVTKWDTSVGNPLVFQLLGHDLQLSRSGSPGVSLNNSNTEISGLEFKHCFVGGLNPESIDTKFTLSARTPNGTVLTQDFFTTIYARK